MFLAFGEIMARIAPPQRQRWQQALPGSVRVTWGGGEANVCVSLAMLGNTARFATALPSSPITDSLCNSLRGLGVDTSAIYWRKQGRLGLYFVEMGANQRGSTVHYDREFSAISLAAADEFDFDTMLAGVDWLHVTGITPAISRNACRTNLELVRRADAAGATVSCDLNFRKKLWNWETGKSNRELARECMADVLSHVDVVIGNEEDAADVLDIHAAGTNVDQGQIDADSYVNVARQIVERFSNLTHVAITLRESISANHNNWGAVLYQSSDDCGYFSPLDQDGRYCPYEIRHIVDRVGTGDSFAAGLLHALRSPEMDSPDKAIAFAVAASCLKHSISGDFNYATLEEVKSLAAGNTTGRVHR